MKSIFKSNGIVEHGFNPEVVSALKLEEFIAGNKEQHFEGSTDEEKEKLLTEVFEASCEVCSVLQIIEETKNEIVDNTTAKTGNRRKAIPLSEENPSTEIAPAEEIN